eukprot:jgi/Astpho2/4589/Aster-00167
MEWSHTELCTAPGLVMSKQANFVSVRVTPPPAQYSSNGCEVGPAPPKTVELLCAVRALLKKIKQQVLVGDRVNVVGIDWADKRGMVQDVLPRHSEMADPSLGNVDRILLVFACALPTFDTLQATKFLVSAEASGIPVSLVLNKADLVSKEDLEKLMKEIKGWGYNVTPVSVASGAGLTELAASFTQRISVVAGPSGVGKSSIINALRIRLLPEMAQQLQLQSVGSLTNIGRGRNTTRHISLMPVGGGLLADTPGFNQPALGSIMAGELWRYFPEMVERLESQRCAFKNCQHLEEPGCCFCRDFDRHAAYWVVYHEVKEREDLDRHRSMSKKRREGTVKIKSAAGGKQTREALLESKTHRRVSRRMAKQHVRQDLEEAEDSV